MLSKTKPNLQLTAQTGQRFLLTPHLSIAGSYCWTVV